MTSRLTLIGLLLTLSCCAGLGDKSSLGGPQDAAESGPVGLIATAEATRNASRFAEAVEIYQQVLTTSPGSVAGQYGMAECLFGLGRAKDAKTIFSALAKDPKFGPAALQGTGLSALALDQRQEAASLLREAVAADPSQWRALNGLALLADYRHQPDEAAALYDRAMALNPDSAVLLNNRGYSRLGAGHPNEAIADFRQALGLDPRSETVQNNLRLALAAKGDYAAATQGTGRENTAVVLNNVGYVAMQRGDLAAAEGLLARARSDNPRYSDTVARNLAQLDAAKAEVK